MAATVRSQAFRAALVDNPNWPTGDTKTLVPWKGNLTPAQYTKEKASVPHKKRSYHELEDENAALKAEINDLKAKYARSNTSQQMD